MRRPSPSSLMLFVGASLWFAPACAESEPQPFQVRVTVIDAHGGPELAEDRVQAIVRRALDRAPSFAAAARNQRSWPRGSELLVASLEYRELPDAADQGRDLLVRLVVETPASVEATLGDDGLDVTVLLERGPGEANLSVDLQLAADRIATILQARTDLATGAPGAVDRLLESADPELVIQTLEWVRDHADESQASAAADRAAALIGHSDERVGLVAIETVGAVGGPEHVRLLLAGVQLADASQVHRAYDALSHLGGPEAERFLQFAARNEEEPGRRAAARRALRRIAEGDQGQRAPNRGHR